MAALAERKSERQVEAQARAQPGVNDAKNVAELLVALLNEAGVKRIFGVAGDALNELTETLRKDGRIEWIGFRHEENAAFAACAEAELTGGLAVCAGTVGPGALHLINGLYNAKREGASVLAITGQVPMLERGTGFFQEVNLTKVFDEACAFQAVVTAPQQMLRLAQIAIQKALTEKTVTRLEIPIDLMKAPLENRKFYHPLICGRTAITPPESEIQAAADLIRSARKITLLCGTGCRDGRDEVFALSDHLKAPIVEALRAKDIFDGRHENVVGLTGFLGTPPGYSAINECDLLIMLGTNFPYENFLPSGIPVIQVDRNIENIGRRASVCVGLLGNVKETVQALLPRLNRVEESPFLACVLKMKTNYLAQMQKETELPSPSPSNDSRAIDPPVIARMISDLASEDAVFAVDVGETTVWTARYIEMRGTRRMIGSFNHGSMGCALPMALGASSVDRLRQVWAICGDGGFVMAMQDFISAFRFAWPIKVVVFNNSVLGFVKIENEVAGNPYFPAATKLVNPDFMDLARSCGATGIRIEKASELESGLKRAIVERGPVLVEVVVSPGTLVFPPKITFDQAWGFGLSKLKEGLLGLKGDHEQWENWKKEFDANLGTLKLVKKPR